MTVSLGLDIGSNSVGSAWIDHQTGRIVGGVSIFPAGVDESDEKRGDPKNAKRRMTRRARITLARRAQRKRLLRLKLISVGLLPDNEAHFKELLEQTDSWELRRKGLTQPLSPHEFGRALLHLAQRRGAMGFDADVGDEGNVKKAIVGLQLAMLDRFGSDQEQQRGRELRSRIESLGKKKRTEQENDELEKTQEQLTRLCQSLLKGSTVTYGRFIAELRDERRTAITTKDRRKKKKGPREWRRPVRNKAGKFEFHADRAMIRDEFAKLWDAQKRMGGPLSDKLTDELRRSLDDESRDSNWRHKGLLFGQRMQSWDLGTLGRCVLEPTERCVPHADMYASRYLVVQMVNDLKILERGKEKRPLSPNERAKMIEYLTGPLGAETRGKRKGLPKTSVTWTDLRDVMDWGPRRRSPFRFNFELSDDERTPNTDWFSREIIHGAVTPEKWSQLSHNAREGINRAILKHDPDDDAHPERLKSLVMQDWAGLSESQADALIAAWRKRPRPDAKRLNMSRRAVRNLLQIMDNGFVVAERRPSEPIQWWPLEGNKFDLTKHSWPTQIAARMIIAADEDFRDIATGRPLDEHARRRYATGAKGATARDRHYAKKHLLKKDGETVYDPSGLPLHEPPPAPLISNPVVRKAIHEVRRHVVEYMAAMRRKPDEIHIELAREARMGKVDADRFLFRNRLRNRIRNEIAEEFNLHSVSSTQKRAAVDRVILAVHQDCVCPLCGRRAYDDKSPGITLRTAALGQGCEVAHILPKACGGHNGFGNIVLAHDECNQEMGRRTPRDFWDATLEGGFDEGISWIENMFGSVVRIKPSETKTATGVELWKCYLTEQARPKRGSLSPVPPNFFTNRFDLAKIEQFKKDIADIQGMTQRQEAATKYASRQVMTYLADSLFEGKGLPERGGDRLVYANDGLWTSRLRREWGLFFDRHGARAKGLTNEQEHERKEKDRGDHRHHAIDAIVIALCHRKVQIAWEEREKQADKDGINTADQMAMENYRRLHPLPPPAPFKSRDEFYDAVRLAIFGDGEIERPVSHRPVKRKLIGAFHKETQYGAVIDHWLQGDAVHRELVKERVTKRQDILGDTRDDFLKPGHLRLPRPETDGEAVDRLARRLRIREEDMSYEQAKKAARKRVKSKGFERAIVDPKPEKGGIVRDLGLRRILRQRLQERGLNPDSYTRADLKKSIDEHGPLTQKSGVPIYRVVLLWSNSDPVTVRRAHYDYATGQHKKLDDLESLRLYDSQNNHHIEIRVSKNKKGNEIWKGHVVSAFEASKQLSQRLRKLGELEGPFRHLRKKLTKSQKEGLSPEEIKDLSRRRRREWKQALQELKPLRKTIIDAYPLVDRSDNDEKGGQFLMSLCEGEMLLMRRKGKDGEPGEVGYFVVAKINKRKSGSSIEVVPHWDARSATERKDSEGKKVSDSKREQFAVTPTDLKNLAPQGHDHAVKVRVSPLGEIRQLEKD